MRSERSRAALADSGRAEPSAPLVPVIDPNAVYFTDTFQRMFRLRKSTIRREWKEGRLRLAKRAGRYFILGEWILQWLRGGELRRSPGEVQQPLDRATSNGAATRH